MAQFTFKNGKIMASKDAAKVETEYQGKRKTQGERAAADQPKQAETRTLSLGNGSEKRG